MEWKHPLYGIAVFQNYSASRSDEKGMHRGCYTNLGLIGQA